MRPPKAGEAVELVIVVDATGAVIRRWWMLAHLPIVQSYRDERLLLCLKALVCKLANKIAALENEIELGATSTP